MNCIVCGSEYHSKFCPDCGAAQPQVVTCAGCGTAHPHDFCPSCGTAGVALACRTEGDIQEVWPAQAEGMTIRPLPAQTPGYPPAGTYPPPPLPSVQAAQSSQPMLAGVPGGQPATIMVNNTSLTGDATTVVTLSPWQGAAAPQPCGMQKNKLLAFLLCFFFGFWGVHRFYTGKIGTGVLWLLSGGLFGIGWLVDVVCIAAGAYKDANGYPLKI